MLIPRLEDENESFENYFSRMPRSLSHVPEDLVQSWFWHHNEQAIELSGFYDFTKWQFRLEQFSNEKIMDVRHYDYYLSKLDDKGSEFLKGLMKGYDTADYMIEHGTFPCAILVAENSGHCVHHQSIDDEMMLEPFHLIEGNRRLGFLRALIGVAHPKLQQSHDVWVADIDDQLV